MKQSKQILTKKYRSILAFVRVEFLFTTGVLYRSFFFKSSDWILHGTSVEVLQYVIITLCDTFALMRVTLQFLWGLVNHDFYVAKEHNVRVNAVGMISTEEINDQSWCNFAVNWINSVTEYLKNSL